VHKNARLTPRGRDRIVRQVDGGGRRGSRGRLPAGWPQAHGRRLTATRSCSAAQTRVVVAMSGQVMALHEAGKIKVMHRRAPPIVEQIVQPSRNVPADVELRQFFLKSRSEPEAARSFIEREIARWTPVIRLLGLKFD
jgi:hypothetical protein